jgi:hypothetical protein
MNTTEQTTRTALATAGHFDGQAFVPSEHTVTLTAMRTRRGALSVQRRARRYGRDLGFSHVRLTEDGCTAYYFTDSH